MAKGDLHWLLEPKPLATIGLGGFALGADCVMLAGGPLIWCGLFSALVLCGFVIWLYAADLPEAIDYIPNRLKLIFPLITLLIVLITGFFIFKLVLLDKIKIDQFNEYIVAPIWKSSVSFALNPETWFMIVVLSGFWVLQTNSSRESEADSKLAFGLDFDAATEKLKSQLGNKGRESGVDFILWDRIQTFPLVRAAFLWVNQTPPHDISMPEGKSYEQFLVFIDAIREGVLEVDRLDDLTSSEQEAAFYVGAIQRTQLTLPVTRMALRAYAEKTGQRPAFLYPEVRPPAPHPLGRSSAFLQWSKATSYLLSEAAALWVDELPANGMSQEAVAVLARLRAAVVDGLLGPAPPMGLDAIAAQFSGKQPLSPSIRVSRDRLVQFATAQNERPWFLFPN